MKKLAIRQVSGNSASASRGFDFRADEILYDFGFRARQQGSSLSLGCIPQEGLCFYIYYQEPNSDSSSGFFRLVCKIENSETEIDFGTASKSRVHEGLDTLTFYGKGHQLPSWSFHCSGKILEETPDNPQPSVFVIQTAKAGLDCFIEGALKLGLENGKHFQCITFHDDLEALLGTGKKLLVLGSNQGDLDYAQRVLYALKKINPRLSFLSCSVMGHLDGAFTLDMDGNGLTGRTDILVAFGNLKQTGEANE